MKLQPLLLIALILGTFTLLQAQDGAPVAPPAPPPPTPEELLAQSRQRAIDQVLLSARSEDPFVRANAIEAAQKLDHRVQPMVQLAIDDEHPVVRFAALATIGQLKLKHMAPSARMKLNDENELVRMAATFALHQCGEDIDISPFWEWLASDDPYVRRNAVMLMGMMGEPSAAPMIIDGVNIPIPKANPVHNALARIQAAEAIAKITANSDDPRMQEYEMEALNALRAGIYSTEGEVRILAVLIMGRIGDKSMRPAIELLLEEPTVEMQLAAAEYLARTGEPKGVDLVIAATESLNRAQRAQAAMTLAQIDQSQTIQPLLTLLDDNVEMVRLAAATAVIHRTSEAVATR